MASSDCAGKEQASEFPRQGHLAKLCVSNGRGVEDGAGALLNELVKD